MLTQIPEEGGFIHSVLLAGTRGQALEHGLQETELVLVELLPCPLVGGLLIAHGGFSPSELSSDASLARGTVGRMYNQGRVRGSASF